MQLSLGIVTDWHVPGMSQLSCRLELHNHGASYGSRFRAEGRQNVCDGTVFQAAVPQSLLNHNRQISEDAIILCGVHCTKEAGADAVQT